MEGLNSTESDWTPAERTAFRQEAVATLAAHKKQR